MRTISELLTILRDNAGVYDNQIYDGLCWEAYEIFENNIISHDELETLYEYIKENMPYYTSEYVCEWALREYGWPSGEWLPRLEWLNEHIELTKN